MLRIQPGQSHPLHGVAATRQIEAHWQAVLPPHSLMQRAGLAVAKLALAVAPHAQRIWIACGPGNNGGDGLEAAIHLQQWGKIPIVTWLGQPDQAPSDAAAAYQRASCAGITLSPHVPDKPDLVIDALLGLGSHPREPAGEMAQWIAQIHAGSAQVLSIDLPSGLSADTGVCTHLHVKATHTMSLLSLKPGVFTAQGRDVSGTVWLDDLGVGTDSGVPADAQLGARPAKTNRNHASHKGSYGDVAIIGGAPGMTGAALLAASAALHSGAGRVLVGLLDGGSQSVDSSWPELMFRPVNSLVTPNMTVVCGCGGGDAVQAMLEPILRSDAQAVLDADALNAISQSALFQTLLTQRSTRGLRTVLTPHPLEAARLLGCTAQQIQANRLEAARQLQEKFQCVVVLKGSGSVMAAPGVTPVINPTGNGKLATAGTGDVLAGMLGAGLASSQPAFQAACDAVFRHGELADCWPDGTVLTASKLASNSDQGEPKPNRANTA